MNYRMVKFMKIQIKWEYKISRRILSLGKKKDRELLFVLLRPFSCCLLRFSETLC